MGITLRWALYGMIVLSLLLHGCDGSIIVEDGAGSSFSRDTAVSNTLGEAYLQPGYRSETITVRDSATDRAAAGIQVLGIAGGDARLYVAADPNQRYHPVITSGESSSYYDSRVYLTPADQYLGANATSYHRVDGRLLYDMATRYGYLSRTVSISGLRDHLASLAYGKAAGLVVCADKPVNRYTGSISAAEVTQRASNLSAAFQAIGWQYIYTSRGYSAYQQVNVWVVDPYNLRIAGTSSGALQNTLVAVVAPTSGSTGAVLPNSLKVELTWDAPVDLDLHLVRNGAYLYDAVNDCFWKFLEQNWGDPYRVTDNPRLLFDNQNGSGPETIVLDEMTPGERYTVAVDYWGTPAGQPSYLPVTATVRVWTRGNSTPRTFMVSGFTYGAPETGQYKVVCDIVGSTGEVTIASPNLQRVVTRSLGAKK